VRLLEGSNTLSFDFLGIKDTITVRYERSENEYRVRLVYVVCCNDDGTFQGPEGEDCSVESAQARICVGGELLQTVMAESLWEAGLGRKSFELDLDPDSGNLVCYQLRTKLSVEECWEMSGEQLWEHVARDIMMSTLKDDKCKYLAFLSCTRFKNPMRIKPTSYAQVLQMTKGHVALGGGGLALFGTGALWTWPSHLFQVQDRLLSPEKVNTNVVMDDSAYRGTVGGSFATTLGSVLHELGHCFDLGHTGEGIMARGFDDLDLFFTTVQQRSVEAQGRPRLDPCSTFQEEDITPLPIGRSNSCNSGDCSPRFTSVRRSDSVSKYLEGYTQKRLRCQQNKNASGVHWTSSCALILSKQKWMNRTPCTNIQTELAELGLAVCCELAVLEVRGECGKVMKHWTEDSPDLEVRAFTVGNPVYKNIVAVANCGNVLKKVLNA